MRIIRTAAVICTVTLAALGLSACSPSAGVQDGPGVAWDCEDVPAVVTTALADGAKGNNMTVRKAQSVETSGGLHLVAMAFTLPDGDDEGVWMTQTLDGSGPFASVDEIAATVSNYPHTINGRTFSITDEGAQGALDCLAKS